LRQCGRRRHRQYRSDNACCCSLHGSLPVRAALPAASEIFGAIMPHGIHSGKALTFSAKRNE
jgi:hypothetical protein